MPALIQTLDWNILYWIAQKLSCGFMNRLMTFITSLGDAGAVWLVVAVLLLCLPRYRRDGIKLILGIALGFLIGNLVLKNLIARPRPCWLDESVQLLVARPDDFSFPSGHTLSSAIAATLLLRADRRFGAVAVPLVALIGFSRLYLFVHFPSDVLAAVLIGIPIALLAGELTDRLFRLHSIQRREKML